MVIICGADESVIGNFHQLPQLLNTRNHLIGVLLGGHVLCGCDSFDFLPVLVRPCQEHYVIPTQSFVACHGVCRYCAVGMTDVQLITGVVNGSGDIKFFFSHKYLSFLLFSL